MTPLAVPARCGDDSPIVPAVRRIGIAIVVLVALVAAGAAGLMAWGSSESTWCYARFDSQAEAEAALRSLRDAAPDAGVDMDTERRGKRISATFESGATGGDAQAFRRAFRPAIREQGATVGHPGDGCLERGPVT